MTFTIGRSLTCWFEKQMSPIHHAEDVSFFQEYSLDLAQTRLQRAIFKTDRERTLAYREASVDTAIQNDFYINRSRTGEYQWNKIERVFLVNTSDYDKDQRRTKLSSSTKYKDDTENNSHSFEEWLTWNRENDRRVLLGRDMCQRLQITKLQCDRWFGDDISCFFQLSRGFLFTFGRNDFGTSFSTRFSFGSHWTLHRLR